MNGIAHCRVGKIEKGDIVVVQRKHYPGLSPAERIFICDGSGFGTNPKAMGTAIFGRWLSPNHRDRIERFEIAHEATEFLRLAISQGIPDQIATAVTMVLEDRND